METVLYRGEVHMYERVIIFKNRRTSVTDQERPGCPSISSAEETLNKSES
jgi:hypothetical protein